MTVGENIRKIRLERKLTQKELGERLGVSQQQITQYENGSRLPKIETIDRIASALDADIADLITGLSPKTKTKESEFVGNRLKQCRIQAGLSQKQLADKAGTSQAAIYYWESGKRMPRYDTMIKIAAYLGISCDSLLQQDECSPQISTMHLTEREERLISSFRELNDQKQEYIITTMALVKNML